MRPIILFLLALFLCQSCCVEDYRIVGNGTLTILETVEQSSTTSEEKRILIFDWQLKNEGWASLNDRLRIPLMAYSCGENFENQLDTTTFLLSLDRGIVTPDGEIIDAGENLVGSKGVAVRYSYNFGGVDVTFSKEFIEAALLPDTTYLARLSIRTTDAMDFEIQDDFFVR